MSLFQQQLGQHQLPGMGAIFTIYAGEPVIEWYSGMF